MKLPSCFSTLDIMRKDPVVHFEAPYQDKQRVTHFYQRAFGWEMQMMEEEYGGYIVAMTTESDENGPKRSGIINGGFFKKDESKPDQFPSVVISVEDIHQSIEKVQQAGGEVLGEPIEIPNVGLYVSFRDTEGNRVGMMQAIRK
ncbi:VOC family protein [Candidatus Roizmanbacteria bacterium]|nr:VOC family protein [Candidatus Roizmanbacteria bacterium]